MLKSKYIFIIFFSLYSLNVCSQGKNDYQYALIEAVKQKNLGNFPGAIELYNMVVAENDSVAVAHFELGTLYAMGGFKDKAVLHLDKAYKLDPTNKWFVDAYIDVLILNEDFKTAKKICKSNISDQKEGVDYEFKLANVYFLAGKSSKAIKTLNKIEARQGFSDKIILLKANIYERDKKYKKALVEVQRIMNYFPESIQFLIVAAELSTQTKNSSLAAEYYTKVFSIDSTNIYAITNLTDYYRGKKDFKKSLYFLNYSFLSDEIDYDKKMAILSYYLSQPYYIDNYSNELEVLIVTMLEKYNTKREIRLFATDFFVHKRDYPRALVAIQDLLVPGEKTYELWNQGILLANVTNNSNAALSFATNAYNEFKDSTEFWFYKGLAEYNNDLEQKAIQTFSSKDLDDIDNNELRGQVLFMLAESYHHIGAYQSSDSIFAKIIDEDPDNYLILNNWSYYLSIRKDSLQKAKKMSFRVITANPDNGTYLDTYAWILYELGEYDDAERYINLALSKGGENDPDVNEHAGDIHKAIGSIQLARAYFQKAIILGGQEDRLLVKLESLIQSHGEE